MDTIAMPTVSHDRSSDTVRQCGFCLKPILKESSYNRHIAYCRRTRQRGRTRAKVCQACSAAKVKCSLQPRCQRCVAKGIDCIYETPAGALATTRKLHLGDSPQIQSVSRGATPEWPLDEVVSLTANGLYPCENAGDMQVDWNLLDFDADPAVSQSPKSSHPCVSELGARPEPLVANIPNGKDAIDSCAVDFDLQSLVATQSPWNIQKRTAATFASALTLTTSVEDPSDSQHLSPIASPDAHFGIIAKTVMEMLRAFPQMMLRRESLPPFVHGHWFHTMNSTNPVLPQPLLNCMGLAQVFASHSPETRSFLWRTIQSEQQTAIEKADQCALSKDDLLASIQAQLIFIMMRMTDRSLAEPGLNFQLLVIFQRLCERFKSLCDQPFFQEESHNPSASWEDWIFAESRRRTAIVWLLVTQMVHIKIGVACDSFEQFREIPLPAPRSLWEARTRAMWQAEIEAFRTRPRTGMETVGDLISASKQSNTNTSHLKLDTWNVGIDTLGVLLNLSVASLRT